MHPGKRALTEKANGDAVRSTLRYPLDHEGQLLCMVVLAVCIRARWVILTPCVRPLLHWAGLYPGYRGIPQSSVAMGAKRRVRPVGD